MKVIIDSQLRIMDAQKDIVNKIKKQLTIKNPKYILKKRIGVPVWGMKENIEFWEENNNELVLPRGYLQEFKYLLTQKKINNISKIDKRIKLAHVDYLSKPNLRDYQKPAVMSAINSHQGIIVMPCGAGKTETALGIVAELGQPTLWITHTMDLLNQSKDRAISRLGLSDSQIGVIQGKNNSIGTHITFATVQTLAKRDLSDIKEHFGCVVVDECHLCFRDDKAERMFNSVLSQLPAYYRFGVTASEYRADGLIKAMYYILGSKIYEVTQSMLNNAGKVIVPTVEMLNTDFFYKPPEDKLFNNMVMALHMREDAKRNSMLVDILTKKIHKDDYCLVLGDSLEHLEALKNAVTNFGRTAIFINGKTKKSDREKLMVDMREGKYQYLFATYQLAKLGLDIPRLNKLVQASPKKDKTSIQQAVGRIMRQFEGKAEAVVYDLWDKQTPQLKYWGYDRAKVYRGLGCNVSNGPRIRGR